MSRIHEQLKARREALGLKQGDMFMRIGMPRQQYQRLESGGNPRLDNLELVAKGLKMELMLIPQEKLTMVQAVIEGRYDSKPGKSPHKNNKDSRSNDSDTNPWDDILEADE